MTRGKEFIWFGWLQPAGEIWEALTAGLCDSLSIVRVYHLISRSPKIQQRFVQCVLLNICIFVGSVTLLNAFLIPLLHWLLFIKEAHHGTDLDPLNQIGAAVTTALTWLYQLALIYPVYIISFVLNRVWYQDIADEAYHKDWGQNNNSKQPACKGRQQFLGFVIATITEELWRTLLTVVMFGQLALFSFVPVIGPIVSGLHYCWLNALYAFEYKWVLANWGLWERLEYVERRWVYFAAYGFPVTMLAYVFPKFITDGFYAFAFPCIMILATVARPTTGVTLPPASAPGEPLRLRAERLALIESRVYSLPIFKIGNRLASIIMRHLAQPPPRWMHCAAMAFVVVTCVMYTLVIHF